MQPLVRTVHELKWNAFYVDGQTACRCPDNGGVQIIEVRIREVPLYRFKRLGEGERSKQTGFRLSDFIFTRVNLY